MRGPRATAEGAGAEKWSRHTCRQILCMSYVRGFTRLRKCQVCRTRSPGPSPRRAFLKILLVPASAMLRQTLAP